MAIIVIPRPLQEKLGEEGADQLVQTINQVAQDSLAFVKEEFERRDRLAMINQALSAFKTDLIQWMFIFSVSEVVILTFILYTMLRLSMT